MAAFALVYPVFLVVSVSFVDADTRLDNRILSPLYPVVLVLSVATIEWALRGRPYGRVVAAVAILGVLSIAVYRTAGWASAEREDLGYNGPRWRGSPTVAALDGTPAGTPLISNGPMAIRFLTGRRAALLPMKWNLRTLWPNREYAAELEKLGDRLGSEGVIVYFHGLSHRDWLPDRAELQAKLPLRAVVDTPDGVLLGSKGSAANDR